MLQYGKKEGGKTMRIFRGLILAVLCLCLLTVPAFASPAVTTVDTTAVVETDGVCRVTIQFQIWLEEEGQIQLWLPAGAEEIRAAGRYRTPETDGSRLRLTLPDMGGGTHTVQVSYELPGVLRQSGEKWYLQLPLLSGFAYPVESFRFDLTLPGDIQAAPVLSSGYHGLNIANLLQVSVEGNRITGAATETLLDRETVELKLEVERSLFPDFKEKSGGLGTWQTLLLGLIGAGALYYLVALLPIIPRKIRATEAPDGLAAGELGSCLTGCGMDLTMMVFSWAQLGYLRIRVDSRGRVLLQKQMDMGNERSDRENRCFAALFSQRDMVDGGGLHYARLCRRVGLSSPLLRQLYKSTSGNPLIARILAMAAGVCSGVVLSFSVYTAGAGEVLLALGLALLCGLFSYLIQSGGRCLPLGNKAPLWLALLCVALWTALGRLCGNVVLAGAMAVYELLVGIAAALGGRRSPLGQQYVAQIRGLRTHLTRASVFDMQQNLRLNPDYFFDRMPYALALGVEKKFARRFGKVFLPECSYLELPEEQERTPVQWAAILRRTADQLNRRQRRLEWEKLRQQLHPAGR